MISEVMGAKERSRRESASSMTRWVVRERMLGSEVAMLERRCGVQISKSMPAGEKRRFRITVAVLAEEIWEERNLTVCERDLASVPTWETSSDVGSKIIARGRPVVGWGALVKGGGWM